MKTTHIINYNGKRIGYQIKKTGEGKAWSYRQTTGSQDQRGLSFDEIRQLPGHWQGRYKTKKEIIALLTNNGEFPIERRS